MAENLHQDGNERHEQFSLSEMQNPSEKILTDAGDQAYELPKLSLKAAEDIHNTNISTCNAIFENASPWSDARTRLLRNVVELDHVVASAANMPQLGFKREDYGYFAQVLENKAGSAQDSKSAETMSLLKNQFRELSLV
jgi:hypothetical protein